MSCHCVARRIIFIHSSAGGHPKQKVYVRKRPWLSYNRALISVVCHTRPARMSNSYVSCNAPGGLAMSRGTENERENEECFVLAFPDEGSFPLPSARCASKEL